MIVNTGSVGLPGYDGQAPASCVVETGTPHACYAILEHAELAGPLRSGTCPTTTRPWRHWPAARECSVGRARLLLVGFNGISRWSEVRCSPCQKTSPSRRSLSGADAFVVAFSSRFWDPSVRFGFATAIFVDAPTAPPSLPTRQFHLNGSGSLLVKI